jgi:hypothetical protein
MFNSFLRRYIDLLLDSSIGILRILIVDTFEYMMMMMMMMISVSIEDQQLKTSNYT